MRWLFDNPQILILIAGAIAYWINQRRKEKTEREMEAELSREPTADEMLERTRRIQEEIRRKIAERRGEGAPPPLPQTPPPLVAEQPMREAPKPVVVTAREMPGPAELEQVLDAQRRYAEQIERLAAEERAAGARAQTVRDSYAQPAAPRASMRADTPLLGRGLDRAALRRAIVLREVLGAPKALQ